MLLAVPKQRTFCVPCFVPYSFPVLKWCTMYLYVEVCGRKILAKAVSKPFHCSQIGKKFIIVHIGNGEKLPEKVASFMGSLWCKNWSIWVAFGESLLILWLKKLLISWCLLYSSFCSFCMLETLYISGNRATVSKCNCMRRTIVGYA